MVKVKVINPFFDKQAKIYREVKDLPFEVEDERAAYLQEKGLVEPVGEEVEEPEVQEKILEEEQGQETVEDVQAEEAADAEEGHKEPVQEETPAAEGEPVAEEVKKEASKNKAKGKSKK